jgi:hypothetical protein
MNQVYHYQNLLSMTRKKCETSTSQYTWTQSTLVLVRFVYGVNHAKQLSPNTPGRMFLQ